MIKRTERLLEVLYVSTLAEDSASGVVANIAKTARVANQQANITGVLIFDGLRFCQQIEGKPSQVEPLMERILRDPRHTDVKILHHGPLSERRFRHFSMGYADIAETDPLLNLGQLEGEAAAVAFLNLQGTLTTLDMIN